jgi:hypothetical protein
MPTEAERLVAKYPTLLARPLRDGPRGYGVQPYIDKIPHYSRARGADNAPFLEECKRALGTMAAHGVSYVAWHSFTTLLTPNLFGPLARLTHAAGMQALAAYGLNSDDMTGKARRIGAVAAMPECAGVVLDGEGKLEDEAAALEDAHVEELLVGLRGDGTPEYPGTAPHALVIVQWWELPTTHGGVYPYEQLALLADVLAPMTYLNNWKGKYGAKRATRMEERWEKEHLDMVRRLGPIVRPWLRMTHSVGWGDIPADLAAMFAAHADLLTWSEPWPDAAFLRAMKRAVGDRGAARKVPA